MRGDEFLEKMELVDFAYVEAADAKPEKKKAVWAKWGAMAACLCLVLAVVLAMGRRSAPRPPGPVDFEPGGTEPAGSEPAGSEPDGMKPLTLPELNSGGMGFEGLLFHDISELKNGNPWSEDMELTVLPVYRNGSYDPSGAGVAIGLSEVEMLERLKHAASALGLEVLSTETSTDEVFTLVDGEMVPNTRPVRIRAETSDGGEIAIFADGRIDYWLPNLSGEGVPLPDAYHFTWHDTTDEEAERVLAYLADAYSELLDFAEPKGVSFGDYNIYGKFKRDYVVYDASGDAVEDILNYHFRSVEFVPDQKGGSLWLIRIWDALLSAEKMGDYPIVSAAEAAERLLAGHYATSAPYAFPGEEYIGKVELVYRTGCFEEIFLPYYRFYVLLPGEAEINASATENGLVTYGAYYVPAITDEYVANMPTYDGRFN